MKQLLSILNRYNKSDAEKMEKESLLSSDPKVGLSTSEKWEIEKDNKDFTSFHRDLSHMSSKTIKIEE